MLVTVDMTLVSTIYSYRNLWSNEFWSKLKLKNKSLTHNAKYNNQQVLTQYNREGLVHVSKE